MRSVGALIRLEHAHLLSVGDSPSKLRCDKCVRMKLGDFVLGFQRFPSYNFGRTDEHSLSRQDDHNTDSTEVVACC